MSQADLSGFLDQTGEQYKAIIAYDGTDFLGFQIQARGRTVQGTLEAALKKIAKQPVRIIGAGRTDTGVHAIGQVISFRLLWRHRLADLHKALNANLPQDIVVLELSEIDSGFHPRFDALSRQYRYTILNQRVRDVFKRRYEMHVSQILDVGQMQQASLHLLGTHDFASFGRAPQGDNTVRTVIQAAWSVNEPEITFEITANAFLYRMVRSIVGTLLEVGLGKLKVDEVKKILLARDRSRARTLVPSNGLCLVKVNY
ncbi:MAG: tRNA pseudouridine(38-40) synthase TruA [Aliifodinibius sp.]|nr:tRNA pseudouridine(38-40) synthase TruA [Fodinibius sp.]NIW96240.1 tRNA pseudouridine(38-40) synthase TruA [Phycisphaerae bacterium]NIX02255.1 tRNA pseudouridine(38-40) synthase TruA [Phycisphaerae bacterium]NIY26826.1 tRNA pseudouridine(38-40) synthase TruA [Fodinibius sp.]